MKQQIVNLDNLRQITIFDDVFTFTEMSEILSYVKGSRFTLNRLPDFDGVLLDEQFRTLKSDYSIHNLIQLRFFNDSTQFLKDIISNNKYRLNRSYVNLSTAQDIYHYHYDSGFDKDLTLVYYVNTKWQDHWEGETHFADMQAKQIVYSASFLPNRIVMFPGTVPHKSSQPSFRANDYRYVLTLKFVHSGNPLYKTQFPLYDMFYNEELPELDSREEKAIAFLKKYAWNIPHTRTSLYEHCLNVFKILKHRQQSYEVCLAGLFHSIYGNEFFKGFETLDREQVVALIGAEAEEIVFRFNQLQDREMELLDPNCFDWDLIQIAYANLIENKARDMSEDSEIVMYANKLEKIKL